jgi:hypothetical protein
MESWDADVFAYRRFGGKRYVPTTILLKEIITNSCESHVNHVNTPFGAKFSFSFSVNEGSTCSNATFL